MKLFERITNPAWLVRRVNITANNTKSESMRQPGLFDEVDEKEGATTIDRNSQIGGHKA
ncbi:MAG: hypothetical protein K6D95_02665 [Treponema sp.]|nr:hypothetical protein [Treponema sp.]